jgi:hypothetical protein
MFRPQQSHHQGFKVTFTLTFIFPFGITTYTPKCMSNFLLTVDNTHCFRLYNLVFKFWRRLVSSWVKNVKVDNTLSLKVVKNY